MNSINAAREASEMPGAELERPDADNEVEILLLAVASALQRVIAERNALRTRTAAQELELTRFRHQSTLIHDSYRRLTNEFVTQFQLIDNAVSNFVRDPSEPEGPSPTETGGP
jgi:hypothetical protein